MGTGHRGSYEVFLLKGETQLASAKVSKVISDGYKSAEEVSQGRGEKVAGRGGDFELREVRKT